MNNEMNEKDIIGKKGIFFLAFIFIQTIILYGCTLFYVPPGGTGEDEHDVNQPQYENAYYEKQFFPEKRRTRAFGFMRSTSQSSVTRSGDTTTASPVSYNLEDFDGDGFKNTEDAYPFDARYPGLNIEEMSLPLIGNDTDNNTSNNFTFRGNISEKYLNVGTFAIKYGSYENPNPCITKSEIGTKVPEAVNAIPLTAGVWQSHWFTEHDVMWFVFYPSSNDKKYYFYWNDYDTDPDYYSGYVSADLLIHDETGNYYWPLSDNNRGNKGDLLDFGNSSRVFIRVVSDTIKNSGQFKLLIAEEPPLSYRCINDVNFTMKNYGTSSCYSQPVTDTSHTYSVTSLDTALQDNDLKIHVMSFGNDSDRDYMSSSYISNLSKELMAYSHGVAERFYANAYLNNYDPMIRDIYRLLTGKDMQKRADLYSFLGNDGSNQTYLFIKPFHLDNPSDKGLGIAKRWGLPGDGRKADDPFWKLFSYDSLIFSTMASNAISNNIQWIGLDNTIYYSAEKNDNTKSEYTNGEVAIDSAYKLRFSNNTVLNLHKAVAIKMLISKTDAGGTDIHYKVKIFVSGEIPKSFADSFHDSNFRLLNLAESGFSINTEVTDNRGEIIYRPENDYSNFPSHVYSQYVNEKEGNSMEDFECYTLFFFFIPGLADSNLWTLVGSTVHFWPLRERCTVVAKLDKDNNIEEGPFALPFEYLVHPDNFIKDDYLISISNSLYKGSADTILPKSPLGKAGVFDRLFDIDVNSGEKLLFMQGMAAAGGSDNCPELDKGNIFFIEKTGNQSFPLVEANISKAVPPTPETTSSLKLEMSNMSEDVPTLSSSSSSSIIINNEVVTSFIKDLNANAYVINFDNLGANRCKEEKVVLQLNQRRHIISKSSLKIHITGKNPPPAPVNLTAQASLYSVQLNWENPLTDEIIKAKGFIVYRAGENGIYSILATIYQPDLTSYIDENDLTENTTYSYKICAFNLENNNSGFAEVIIKTPQSIPIAPSNLQVVQQNNMELYLSWEDESFNEDGFILEKTEEGVVGTTQYSIPANQTEYKDTKVSVGKTYGYKVKARNSAGDSAYTEGVSVQFQALKPDDLSSLSISLLQEDGTVITDHWIPNTEQFCTPFRIQIKGFDTASNPLDLIAGSNIKILSPVDPYWDTADTDPNANINRNKGTTDYSLYATNKEGTEVNLLLATFEINTAAATQAESFKMVAYNSLYFDGAGKINEKDGYAIKVNSSGNLYFETNLLKYEYFALKILNGTGTIRPGDDMLLRFGLTEHADILANPQDDNINFMAVYDKILLDRANLYIDERIDSATGAFIPGVVDWNGDQQDTVQIAPATWHSRDFNGETNQPVYGAVIYSISTQDSPLEFNEKLRQQVEAAKALGEFLLEYPSSPYTEADFLQILALLSDLQEKELVSQSYLYNSSTAMYSLKEGLTPEVRKQLSDILIRTGYMPKPFYKVWYEDSILPGYPLTLAPLQSWDYYWRQGHDVNFDFPVPMGGFYPYCPALSSHPGQDEYWSFTKISTTSAGVDCVGLVQRSASYRQSASEPDGGYLFDNAYTLPDIGPVNWDDTGGNRRYIVTRKTLTNHANFDWLTQYHLDNNMYYLWEVSAKSLQLPDSSYPYLNRVIPGDIIYYTRQNGYHVALILSVNVVGNLRNPTINDIGLIESTFTSDWGRVTKQRTVSTYRNNEWVIGRLIQ